MNTGRIIRSIRAIAVALLAIFLTEETRAEEPRSNVLLIAVDDLNDWVGCLGGRPQTNTPNIDRLAAQGVLFTNAHCQGTLCNPSRISLLWGRGPSSTGFYSNRYPVSKELGFLSSHVQVIVRMKKYLPKANTPQPGNNPKK